MWKGGEYFKKEGEGSAFAILDNDFRHEALEREYIGRQAPETPVYFIAKTLLTRAFHGHYRAQTRWFFFGLSNAFRCFFNRKNRVQYALHTVFVAELSALAFLVEREKVQGIYDFAPYLIDSNWAYLFLKEGLENYAKLPSPGPLKTHNRITLCDQLIISSAYHEEELPHLGQLRYTHLNKWVPEWAFTYIDRYWEKPLESPKKTLGFYSHGSWLRRLEGHSDDKLRIDESEEQLLNDLSAFLDAHPDFHLTVFLHPRERKSADAATLKAHYDRFIFSDRYDFSDGSSPSTHCFEQVDIGLAAFSTILYERLFCGFKTLIGNYYTPDFPIQGSVLEAICFNDRSTLFTALTACAEETNESFFRNRSLMPYHYSTYPYFQRHDRHH